MEGYENILTHFLDLLKTEIHDDNRTHNIAYRLAINMVHSMQLVRRNNCITVDFPFLNTGAFKISNANADDRIEVLHYYLDLLREKKSFETGKSLHNIIRTMRFSRHEKVCGEDFSRLDFGNIPLNSIDFSSNGNIPSKFIGSKLNEWNFLSGHTHEVHALCVSSDEKYIITGGFDKKAIIWDPDSGCMVNKLSGHTGDIEKIYSLGDSKCLIYCAYEKSDVFLWNIENSYQPISFLGLIKKISDIGLITDISVSNDKDKCAIVTKKGYLFIWELNSGRIKCILFNGISINCVVWDNSGTDKCIIGTNSGSIFEISISDMKHKLLEDISSKTLYNNSAIFQYCRPGLAPYCIRCLDYSGKAGLLFVGMQGGVSKLIDLKNKKSKRFEFRSPASRVFISPLGKYAISLFGIDKFIMYDLNKHIDIIVLTRPDYTVNSYVLSGDETFCLLGDGIGNVYYLDVLTKKITKSSRVHTGNVLKIVFIDNENKFVSVSQDGSVAISDTNTFERIRYMPHRESIIRSMNISVNNRYCIMCAERDTAVIYDNKEGTRTKLRDPYGLIHEVAFTSDSKYAITTATPSTSASIPNSKLYKISDITDVIELPGYAYKISTSLSLDGHNLVAFKQPGMIKIFNVEKNEIVQTIEYSNNHISAKFSFTGKSNKGILTIENIAVIIDLYNGKTVKISDHNGYVSGALSDDGRYCITSSSENIVFGARDNSAIIHDLLHTRFNLDELSKVRVANVNEESQKNTDGLQNFSIQAKKNIQDLIESKVRHKKNILETKDERIDNVAYISDSQIFATISKNKITFWNVKGKKVREYIIKGQVSKLQLSSDGKYLLLQRSSKGLPNFVECIDIEKDEVIYTYYPIDNCNVQNCDFSYITGDDNVKELLKRNGAIL